MNTNCCINLKVKTKNYKKFLYCKKADKVINFDNCRNCIFKEYAKKKIKKHENLNSIMPLILLKAPRGKTITCVNHKVPYYHKNHIFEGRNRSNSEKYGLFIWMDPTDHIFGNESFHNNRFINNYLKREGQKAFEKKYPDLNFVEIFGENYL